ncbi:unnamed protein product [Cylindrotheca closterium]|uniref:Uncharacterized protein n=1 Tax=Cylindrotheca closterium TaxID=2856 RepID=A0AAD2FN38_9STRA|nr:unnamed protein product [Cylindrotheca closterium]
MLFQTVLIPATLIAVNSDQILARNFANNYDNTPATRFERHASQRQFLSNCYNAGTSLLNSMQTTETTQHVQQEHQAQFTSMFQWFEQRESVAAPVPVAVSTIAPATNLRSHPTQSDLVQRFASIFSPLSMATSVAACEPVKPMKAPESTWGRWFN